MCCICSTFDYCRLLHSAVISVSPVLARPPIPHAWRANPTDDIARVKTNLKDVYIHVKFTFQFTIFTKLSISVLLLVMPLPENFANKPSTFLLISIILRWLVTMQFFATAARRGALNDGKSSSWSWLSRSRDLSPVCDEIITNTNAIKRNTN